MAAKKIPDPPPKQEFTISASMLKWTVSLVAALFAAVAGYWVIADRVDQHWRLEQVQAAKDKEYAAEIKRVDAEAKIAREKAEADVKAAREKAEGDTKAAREKAESDTKVLAKKAESGRAWVVWSITDTKAYTATKFAKVCKALKLPSDECATWDDDSRAFKLEATDKKHEAENSSKEK